MDNLSGVGTGNKVQGPQGSKGQAEVQSPKTKTTFNPEAVVVPSGSSAGRVFVDRSLNNQRTGLHAFIKAAVAPSQEQLIRDGLYEKLGLGSGDETLDAVMGEFFRPDSHEKNYSLAI